MSVTLHLGDCLSILPTLPANSIDSIVTDPPYGLSNHNPQDVIDCLKSWLNGEPYQPAKKGFMGKSWDGWVAGPEVWRECLRVLKPGGMLLCFAGTRSMDLASMAIRLAGFELRDSIGYAHDSGGAPLAAWCFGSGFPKSHDISKAIDKASGVGRQNGKTGGNGPFEHTGRCATCGKQYFSGSPCTCPRLDLIPVTDAAKRFAGFGSALKPAWEPIIMAMKPLDKNFANNALKWNVAGLNIDQCRIDGKPRTTHTDGNKRGQPGQIYGNGKGLPSCEYPGAQGRWPANLILDEEAARLLDQMSGVSKSSDPRKRDGTRSQRVGNEGWDRPWKHGDQRQEDFPGYADQGGASRFFYCAKASKRDRDEGLEGMEPKYKMRDDLTAEQREYVTAELQRLGLA